MGNPNNAAARRRTLVQKLYSQFTMPGGSKQGATGVGTPAFFNPGLPGRAAPITRVTAPHNVFPGVQSLLGPGGFRQPLNGDVSQATGGEVRGAPDVPMPLPSPVAMPLPGQISSPPPPTVIGAGAPPGPVNSSLPSNEQLPFDPQAPVIGGPSQVAPAPPLGGGIPPDAIPLGGGVFWSPTVGIVSPPTSGPGAVGGAARNVGGGGSSNAPSVPRNVGNGGFRPV